MSKEYVRLEEVIKILEYYDLSGGSTVRLMNLQKRFALPTETTNTRERTCLQSNLRTCEIAY